MIRGRRPIDEPRANCAWCRSTRSVEHGICQVCLAEYPLDTRVIDLAPSQETGVVALEDRESAAAS